MKQGVTFREVWRVMIGMLGSLKLAVILLLTIAIACTVATFAESKFNAEVAKYYVYQAPWFIVWLLVLCVNLAAATLTRWPWRKKHLGFVITHLGIIILLIGALVGRLTGFEGFVHLRIGEEPTGRITLNKTMFQVESPADGVLYAIDFPLGVSVPSADKPRRLVVPNSSLHLKIDGYAEHVEQRPVLYAAREGDQEAAAGVELEFKSQMMNQAVPMVLIDKEGKNENTFFGRALVRWFREDPNVAYGEGQSENPKRETHVVFAKMPAHPVIHADSGNVSGVRVFLVPKAKDINSALAQDPNEWKVIVRLSAEDVKEYDLTEIMGKRVPIFDGLLDIEGQGYWHDFTMQGGVPVNKGRKADNPAVIIHFWSYNESALRRRLLSQRELQLWLGNYETVHYRVLRESREVVSGSLQKGESLVPGWADWRVEVKRIEHLGKVKEQVLPAAVPIMPVGTNSGAVPGLHVELMNQSGETLDKRWIMSGEITSLFSSNQVVRVGFGLKTQPLPFTVRLDRFEVPRDEGTEAPANFLSYLTFRDLKTGRQASDVAQMNYPASFPGGFWRSALGLNYKFSQASWNPNDLNVTTLQVLYDPGWSLKWIGSLILCLGIVILFRTRKPNLS
jgi:hypothetical protein